MVTPTDVELLSSAPWFDAETANDLLALGREAHVTSIETHDLLASMTRTGLLVRRLNSWRVSEPLRSELRQSLAGQNRVLYDEAIRTFSRHAADGFGIQLAAIMGERGADLNLRAAAASTVEQGEHFNRLVEYVEELAELGESRDAFIAADLVELYSGTRDRRSEFLRGLGLWNGGNRAAAESAFESVRAAYHLDRAGAISCHLLAVLHHQRGEYADSIGLLQEAIADLRLMDDLDGLCMTMTTFGRVLKDRYKDTGSPEDLLEARRLLNQALSFAKNERTAVSVRLALAQVEQIDGNLEDAIALAEDALKSSKGSDQYFAAAITLAALYRSADRDSDAIELANNLEASVGRSELSDIKYARLLNVTAAAERKLHRFRDAERHARRSVEIGRHVGDQRHVAHALHTMAAVRIDALGDEPGERMRQVREIRSQLAEARGILASLHNSSGVAMIDRTTARLDQALISSDVEGDRRPGLNGRS